MAYTQQTPIGTPDFNLITKTLAGLQPDSALQQYAQLHKNNPYILSLAKSESDRRKSLRTAAQGNPGQMPTVADREIAGMAPAPMMAQQQLPENQGIAQIPTPNIRTMADGGIAGYEDDEEGMATGGMGGMFNFAQQSEPVVRMSGGGAVPSFASGAWNNSRFLSFLKENGLTAKFAKGSEDEKKAIIDAFGDKTSGPQKPAAQAASTTAAPTKEGALYKPAKAAGEAVKYGKGALKGVPFISGGIGAYQGISDLKDAGGFYNDPNVSTFEKAKQAGLTTVKAGLPIAAAGIGSLFTPAGTFVGGLAGTAASEYLDLETDALKAWKKANPQATPEQTQKAAVALAPAPAPEAAPAPVPEAKPEPSAGGVKDLLPVIPKFDTEYKPATAPTAADAKAKAADLYDSKGQIRSLEGKQAQARQDILNQRDERLAQLDAFNKAQGPAFANYEKMLQKEELQDATDKEKSGLMSLMKGFLAMAAGESPNAATNIAKGAMVGMGDYGDALKEFKKAAKERTKAMADIENARRAEAKGDFKDTQMYTDRANERLADSADRFTGLISQVTGKESDVAASLFNNMTNNAEETSRMMFKESGLNKRFMAEQAGLTARANAQLKAPSAQMQLFSALGKGDIEKGLNIYSGIMGPEAKGDQAIIAKYSGPQGQIALQMLEAQGPDGKAQADLIRQIIKQSTGSMLRSTSSPTGQVLVGQ
jgi:hypothetical protein